MQLANSLRISSKTIMAFIGAGGKTSAMFRLADDLSSRGQRVITTTTTRMGITQTGTNQIPLRYVPSPDFFSKVRTALDQNGRVHIVGDAPEEGKVGGVPPTFIDELATLEDVDTVLYEADGARGLPFKAPAVHEPVISNSTTAVVQVVGISIVGSTLDNTHVHRAEIAALLAGTRIGEMIMPIHVARVIAHADGGMKNIPQGARIITLINQVETNAQLEIARVLAQLILDSEAVEAVAIGAVRHSTRPIYETHRRIAAIVLAAGASSRMQGYTKQLLPWQGKTLIENAINIATTSQVKDTFVVLGAHSDDIHAKISHLPVYTTLNREWLTGQSSSIRAGLLSLPKRIAAAIFINCDQPLLVPDVIDEIIQQYRETDALIICSRYAGRRGSPVLFDRRCFDELAQLRDDQGGRELLAKYQTQVEFVDFSNANMSLDIDTYEDYKNLCRNSGS